MKTTTPSTVTSIWKHFALRFAACIAILFGAGAAPVNGALIAPTAATAQSFFSPDSRSPARAIDGSGMAPNNPAVATSTCGNAPANSMWLSNGIQATWITFDLGSVKTITGFHLWNYNENSGNPANFTKRGVRTASIYAGASGLADGAAYASAGPAWGALVQDMTFSQAPGTVTYAGEDYTFATPVTTRYLQIYVTSNFGGDAYTGISEIRFYEAIAPATILTFGTNIVGSTAVISPLEDNGATIAWTVPYGTPVASLAPTFTVSSGTSVPSSGVVPNPDFSAGPVTYTVTDGGTTNVYLVTVTVDSLIRATAATAESFFAPDDRAPGHAIDGRGMTPNNPVVTTSTSGNIPGTTMWLSNGVRATWITFDLGSVRTIGGFHLWNYNEVNGTFVGRGIKTAEVYIGDSLLPTGTPYSSAGPAWGTLVQGFTFSMATGLNDYAGADYNFAIPVTTRYLQIYVTSNFGTNDAYTGISEIAFTPPPPDTDNDLLPDEWEMSKAGNLTDLTGLLSGPGPGPGTGNFDGDSLTDFQEYALNGTYPNLNPKLKDTDGDGLEDGAEVNPTFPRLATNPTVADTDGDGLSDLVESNSGVFVDLNDPGTNPNSVDSDGDQYPDGYEVSQGGNPLLADSFPAALPPGIALGVVTDEASTGISSAETYTHKISGGGAATVNGVDLDLLSDTVTPLNFTWNGNAGGKNIIQPITNNTWNPAAGNVTGAGNLQMFGGFTFSGAGAGVGNKQQFTLSALDVGVTYEMRIFIRKWADDTVRPQLLSFINGAQVTNFFILEDRPETVLGNGNRESAYYISFTYTAQSTSLTLETTVPNVSSANGSFHMFALTNRTAGPPAPLDLRILERGLKLDQGDGQTKMTVTLEIKSRPNRIYAVEFSTDLVNWTELVDSWPSAGTSTIYLDTIAAPLPAAFYRVRDATP